MPGTQDDTPMVRSAVTPSLLAPDLDATLRFYVDVLGFSQTGAWREADARLVWAEVTRGDARLWFFRDTPVEPLTPVFSGLIYLFVGPVTPLAAALADVGVIFEWGPETQPYGLREVALRDPNGYLLVFAEDVD